MKALELLKNLKNEMQNNDGIINWDCSYEYFKKVDNSIKELEALQNRKCTNCIIMFSDHTVDNDLYCTKLNKWVEKDFYCSKWESK